MVIFSESELAHFIKERHSRRAHSDTSARQMASTLDDSAAQKPWHRAAATLVPKFNAAIIIAQRHQRHQTLLTVALGATRWRRKAAANKESKASSQLTGNIFPPADDQLACTMIARSHAAASKIAAVFRGRQARRLLRNTQGKDVAGKIGLSKLTALERWELRGVVLSAVRVHTLRQRELERQVAIRRGTEPDGNNGSSRPSSFWSLARSGLATGMAAVRGPSTRLTTDEAEVEAVIEVAAQAAEHRWRIAHFSAGFTSSARLLHEKSFRRMTQVEGGDVTTQVDSNAQALAMRRWEQGDEELYEASRLYERFQNRSSPQVRQQLNAWWTWAQSTFAADVSNTPRGTSRPVHEHLLVFVSEAMYNAVMIRINRALLDPDEPWDQEEAEELVQEAWLSDTHGRGKTMSRTEWNDSLFELADMWTLTTEANEYAEFLMRLLEHVRNADSTSCSFVWNSFGMNLDEATLRSARLALGREREARSCTHRLFRSAQLLQGLWRKKLAAKEYKKHRLNFTSAQLIQGMLRKKIAARQARSATDDQAFLTQSTAKSSQAVLPSSFLPLSTALTSGATVDQAFLTQSIAKSSQALLPSPFLPSSMPPTSGHATPNGELGLHGLRLNTRGISTSPMPNLQQDSRFMTVKKKRPPSSPLPNLQQLPRFMSVKERPPSSLRQRSA